MVQVKTLDVNSQHERTDGIRRKLREEAVAADVDDAEERGRDLKDVYWSIQKGLEKIGKFFRNPFKKKQTVDQVFQKPKSTLGNVPETAMSIKSGNQQVVPKAETASVNSNVAKADSTKSTIDKSEKLEIDESKAIPVKEPTGVNRAASNV